MLLANGSKYCISSTDRGIADIRWINNKYDTAKQANTRAIFQLEPTSPRFLWTLHHFLLAILRSFFFLPFFPPFYYYRDISIGSSSKIDRNGEQFAALCTYTRFARFVPDNVSLLYLSLENKITRRIVATGLDTIFSNKAFRIHIYIYINANITIPV